jgi:hypothetical protein
MTSSVFRYREVMEFTKSHYAIGIGVPIAILALYTD